jgi:hypothetical protein
MYALTTLLRVAEGRGLLGSLLATPDAAGLQQPGVEGVHAIKFEGGGSTGLDDVIAVWCPRTDDEGCAFSFSEPPVRALDRVGRSLSVGASVYTTSELDGVRYYFFPHPAPQQPPPGPVCPVGAHCAFLPLVMR